jgi:hypothetical protein
MLTWACNAHLVTTIHGTKEINNCNVEQLDFKIFEVWFICSFFYWAPQKLSCLIYSYRLVTFTVSIFCYSGSRKGPTKNPSIQVWLKLALWCWRGGQKYESLWRVNNIWITTLVNILEDCKTYLLFWNSTIFFWTKEINNCNVWWQ